MNLKTVGALGIVYVVWGSTYLAIRYAIEGFPPLLSAGAAVPAAGAAHARLPGACAGRPRCAPPAPSSAPPRCPGSCCSPAGNGLVTRGRAAGRLGPGGAAHRLRAAVDRDPAALLRDRPGPATALGVLIGLAGVALIFLPGGSGGTDLGVRGAGRAGRAVLGGRLAAGDAAAGAGRPADADHGGDGRRRPGAAGRRRRARRARPVRARRGARRRPGSRWPTWSCSAR